jgi:hypothetical protein
VYWIPPEEAYAWSGILVASGSAMDPAWENWRELMSQYQQATNSSGLTRISFWLVVGLPGDSFSDKLEFHEEVPMLMPISGSGKFLGIAQSKAELDKMVTSDKDNVHLTYKVKLQGQKAWRDLLEFLATHDMLEKE